MIVLLSNLFRETAKRDVDRLVSLIKPIIEEHVKTFDDNNIRDVLNAIIQVT